MRVNHYLIIVLGLMIILFSATAGAGERPPAVAGAFYPADSDALGRIIAELTARSGRSDLPLPENKQLRALIMPHAGYQYSGYTAAHAYQALKQQPHRYSQVIIMGPDHQAGFDGCGISDVSAYQTPLGKIELHRNAERLRRKYGVFTTPPPVSEVKEHSVEVILPFLQTWLPSFRIVPIVTGRVYPDYLSRAISPLLDGNTLIVASSDLSHYLPHQEAVKKDRQTIENILNLSCGSLYRSENRACGKIPIEAIMRLARQHDWEPVLLHYSNSGDTSGNRDRVVGYTVIAFYGGPFMASKKVTKAQGEALVQLARKTILESLGIKTDGPELDLDKEEALQSHCGTFVTLNKNGELRGCIGSLTADESIVSGVKRNAVNAAFQDPRFPALSKEEADEITIEVSILSEPQPLEYEDANDLLAKLCPEVDGVIIKKGLARATFLPQVWQQLPERTVFLEHLCVKAGLPPNAWEQGDLEVYTYQVQYFEENH
ncbi:MAG: AmmeMemoRadiSam system protein B [Desulfosudaceae bacterium]